MECAECVFHRSAINPCQLGEGSKGSKIMVIGENPTEHENKIDEVFSSADSVKFKESLKKRGIRLKDVYFTYALKCPVPEGVKVKQSHISACKSYLEAEIELVDPKIIVPLGNHSLNMVTGKTGITKQRGRVLEVGGRTIIPTFHPKEVSRKPGFKPMLLEDLDRIAEIYNNGTTSSSGETHRALMILDEIMEELDRMERQAEWLSFDVETTGKNPFLRDSKIVCISLSDRERYGVAIPLLHRESPLKNDGLGTVVKRLRKLLANSNIGKVGHNGKFDMKWLETNLDISVVNYAFDTMLAHYIAVSEEQGFQNLEGLSWSHTDMGGYDNELKEYRDKLPESIRYNYDHIPWAILSKYAAGDSDCVMRLLPQFKLLVEGNPKWNRIMKEIMIPGSYAFKEIEKFGMKMDRGLAQKYTLDYQKELERIEGEMRSYSEVVEMERDKLDMYNRRQALLKSVPKKDRTAEQQKFIDSTNKYKEYRFNFGSVQQLQELLFERMGLTTSVTTDSGAFSTNKEALEEMYNQHDLPKTMIGYRKVDTLNSMFILKLPPLLDDNDIVHPSFNLSGTVTGRLSSEDPNAQQFTRKSEDYTSFQYSHEPKRMFISRFGKEGCILQFDYSQLELRIAGTISEDKNLLKAFQSGEDIHKATASLVWGMPVSKVSKDNRTDAKAVNFGIIYGKSGPTFAKDIYGHLPYEEALKKGNKLVDDYLETFYGLAEWIEFIQNFARKHGYVENLFGLHRRLPDIKSRDNYLRSEAERQAQNTPIQGTGAMMTNLSCIKAVETFQKQRLKSMIISTVHDSIVLDVYVPELEFVSSFMRDTMENIHKPYFDDKGVPYKADAELGDSYAELYEVNDFGGLSNTRRYREWVDEKTKEEEMAYQKAWEEKLKGVV